MCLIIAIDRQRSLPTPTFHAALRSAVRRNPDGIGLAWPHAGKVQVVKHKSQYGPVIEQALDIYEHSDLPFFVHLRMSTVGTTSARNTHPFVLSPSLAMAHNKTLAIEPPHHCWSDSRTVAELLKLMLAGDPKFFDSPLFWSFIEHQAGKDNRFAFLDASEEKLVIVNEHLGIDVEGMWFSNLYAWDPGTVGFTTRSRSTTSKLHDHDDDLDFEDVDGWDPRWDFDDVPLAWGADGVDRRQLEAALTR